MSINKVLYNIDQRSETTDEEKNTARNNIGATDEAHTMEWHTENLGVYDGKLKIYEDEVGTLVSIGLRSVKSGNPNNPKAVYLVPYFNSSDNGKSLSVKNNVLQFVDKSLYKGFMIIDITGSCSDATGSIVLSDKYNHDSYTLGNNTATVTYIEQDNKPSDSKPSVFYDSFHRLILSSNQKLKFSVNVSISSYVGYDITDIARWGYNDDQCSFVGSMNNTLVYGNGDIILNQGITLKTATGGLIGTDCKVRLVTEYLYTSTGA